MKNLLFTIFFICSIPSVRCASCTWNGGSGNWNDPTKWSCGSVPGMGDDVTIISGIITLNVAPTVLSLTMSGGELTGSNILTVSGAFNLNGAALISSTSTVKVNGAATISAQLTVAVGILELNGGVSWTAGDIFICNDAIFRVAAGQTMDVSAGPPRSIWTPCPGNNGRFEMFGNLVKTGPEAVSFAMAFFTNSGTTTISGGMISVDGNGTATLSGPHSLAMGTTLRFTGGGTKTNSGTLSGHGLIDANVSFIQNGSISPGSSPGILTFSQLPAGTISTLIELQGTATPGVDYDQIAITGAGVVGGTLNISFLSGFTPQINDEFTIMTCGGGCSGSFSSIVHLGGNPNAWQVTVAANNVKLKLVQALPIELTLFRGFLNETANALEWQTASELNADRFEIERSKSEKADFEKIGQVAASGFSTELKSYEFIDREPPSEAFYRLKMVDSDGKFEYSKIVFVKRNDRQPIHIFPNPVADGSFEIQFEEPEGELNLAIFDALGRLVFEKKVESTGGFQTQKVAVERLVSGFYRLELNSEKGQQSASFIKN